MTKDDQMAAWQRAYRAAFCAARAEGKDGFEADAIAAERAYESSGLARPVTTEDEWRPRWDERQGR
jgi:hypothetical protein